MPPSDIHWRDKTPFSARFDDPYFSLEDGLAESRYVFLEGNDLPERFRGAGDFHIAELGFGTGLNFLAAWQLWQQVSTGGILQYTGFEMYPLETEERQKALAVWPELAPLVARLGALDAGIHVLKDVRLTLIHGDAREALPAWGGKADAWFLDGFAPARNPELWEPELMQAVGAHTKPGGSFATYTAAGAVRQALTEAGFTITRLKGYGRKRHMSRGVMQE